MILKSMHPNIIKSNNLGLGLSSFVGFPFCKKSPSFSSLFWLSTRHPVPNKLGEPGKSELTKIVWYYTILLICMRVHFEVRALFFSVRFYIEDRFQYNSNALQKHFFITFFFLCI